MERSWIESFLSTLFLSFVALLESNSLTFFKLFLEKALRTSFSFSGFNTIVSKNAFVILNPFPSIVVLFYSFFVNIANLLSLPKLFIKSAIVITAKFWKVVMKVKYDNMTYFFFFAFFSIKLLETRNTL